MSPKLHILRLDLPGLWSDGWLYKEHLILWSRGGRMHFVPLSDVVKMLREMSIPPIEILADFLVFRNDWKASEQFERLMSLPGMEKSFIANFPRGGEEIVLPLEGLSPVPISGDHVPGVILDSTIYADRVYTGSTQGLFETRFDADSPTSVNPLVSRMGKRVGTVTAGYSAVNGSAGDDGLWFGPMKFDGGPWWDEKSSFRQVAEFSKGNSFAGVNLLNYTDEAFPGFLRSETVKDRPRGNLEYEERRITGYERPTNIGGLMTSALISHLKIRYDTDQLPFDGFEDSVEVLGNSDQRLLVAWGESLRVVDLSLHRGRDLKAKPDKSFRDIADLDIDPYAILDTHAFGKGFLVELSDEVRLINSQGSFTLISGPVARIRTFARSKRYKEVALLVRETGVSLLGFYIAQEADREWS